MFFCPVEGRVVLKSGELWQTRSAAARLPFIKVGCWRIWTILPARESQVMHHHGPEVTQPRAYQRKDQIWGRKASSCNEDAQASYTSQHLPFLFSREEQTWLFLCPEGPTIKKFNPDRNFQSRSKSGNGLRVKTQRVKTSENFSEESNLPRRFRRYPEIL